MLAASFSKKLYNLRSFGVNSTHVVFSRRSGNGCDNSIIFFVRRRQVPLISKPSLFKPCGSFSLIGLVIQKSNRFFFIKTGTPTKLRSAAKSSRELWIGVPVKHQRYQAWISHAALKVWEFLVLIWCAIISVLPRFPSIVHRQCSPVYTYLRQGLHDTIAP